MSNFFPFSIHCHFFPLHFTDSLSIPSDFRVAYCHWQRGFVPLFHRHHNRRQFPGGRWSFMVAGIRETIEKVKTEGGRDPNVEGTKGCRKMEDHGFASQSSSGRIGELQLQIRRAQTPEKNRHIPKGVSKCRRKNTPGKMDRQGQTVFYHCNAIRTVWRTRLAGLQHILKPFSTKQRCWWSWSWQTHIHLIKRGRKTLAVPHF